VQYGDAAFKRMLGSVVDIECWEGAREAAASQGKALSKQAATAEGVISALEAALQRLQVDLSHKQQQERDWEQRQEAEKVRFWGGVFPCSRAPSLACKLQAATSCCNKCFPNLLTSPPFQVKCKKF
jgi:septal ring factor EnvC (AmiA/AmiB activator)